MLADEAELFAAATKIDLAAAVKHLRDWMSHINGEHRQKYADLLEAQANLIAWLVQSRLALSRQAAAPQGREALDLRSHLQRQRDWSGRTFGPGSRVQGVVDHIRKELREIEANPTDLTEWIDVVILALDGAWRSGATPDEIIAALVAKQTRNENREWPDWRTADPHKAIEHIKSTALACQAQNPGEDKR